MRVKLVQGTNSMSYAKSVLPTFMAHPPGYGSRKTTQERSIQLQIGTTQNRLLGRATIGFQQDPLRFNRTLLVRSILLVPVPQAVWLFGSAFGLMDVVRRKIS